jgi:hypothetical protein
MRRDRVDRRQLGRLAAAFPAALVVACATAKPAAPTRVDLEPARQAVESARRAGASEKAEPVFTKALGHLNEAETLTSSPPDKEGGERSREAEGLARLALAEAECAESMAHLTTTPAHVETTTSPPDTEKLRAQLRHSEEEQRRLEERVALLQRDLDVTETEVIRTKAKLKGNETKAEASSAIAEARILMRRLADEGSHSPNVARFQELLDRAEQQLKEENFGAAAFFATKAQELLESTRRGNVAALEQDRAAPKEQYVTKSGGANLRRGPALGEPVVGKIPAGASVVAVAIRGDWLKVKYGELTGWAFRPLFE